MAVILVILLARNMEILHSIISHTIILTMQKFVVPPSFRGEHFLNFSQSETRIAHFDHVFSLIGMK